MDEKVWQLQEAKNKFSKMVSPRDDLVEFFSKSPLKQADIDFSKLRSKEIPRKLEIS